MKVIFNFKKSTCRLNWVKILKVVFGFNLKEAKAIVDSGSYVHIVDNLNNTIDAQQYFETYKRKIISVRLLHDDNNGGYYIELNNEIIADKHMTIDYNE